MAGKGIHYPEWILFSTLVKSLTRARACAHTHTHTIFVAFLEKQN